MSGKPTANDVDWEFSLQFQMPTRTHRVEQSWPRRNGVSCKNRTYLVRLCLRRLQKKPQVIRNPGFLKIAREKENGM